VDTTPSKLTDLARQAALSAAKGDGKVENAAASSTPMLFKVAVVVAAVLAAAA
jgi:hypothetical protein